jgi:hypothetical protein
LELKAGGKQGRQARSRINTAGQSRDTGKDTYRAAAAEPSQQTGQERRKPARKKSKKGQNWQHDEVMNVLIKNFSSTAERLRDLEAVSCDTCIVPKDSDLIRTMQEVGRAYAAAAKAATAELAKTMGPPFVHVWLATVEFVGKQAEKIGQRTAGRISGYSVAAKQAELTEAVCMFRIAKCYDEG